MKYSILETTHNMNVIHANMGLTCAYIEHIDSISLSILITISLLNVSSVEAYTSTDHFLFSSFLSLVFHELWHCIMSTRVITL